MSDWIYDPTINPEDYYGFVYLITRLDTGRQYVGRKYLTAAAPKKKGVKRPPRRASNWKTYWGLCKPLNEDIATYGHNMFKREIIRWCVTRTETNYAEIEEQFARDVLKAKLPDGSRAYYNGNILSRYFAAPSVKSPESSAKTADALRGRKRPREVVEKIVASRIASGGYVVSPERRAAHSAKMKGRFKGRAIPDEQKAKISASLKGKKHSEERRKNISQSLKGRTLSDETKQKLSQSLKGRVFAEETIERMRQAALRRYKKD